jgi:hypothetical protein
LGAGAWISGAGPSCADGSGAVRCCSGCCRVGGAGPAGGSDSGPCGTGLLCSSECWCGRAAAGSGGVAGIGSAGGAIAGFGEPVFGGMATGPKDGLGSLPGAMLAGVGSDLRWGRASFGGV